MKGPVDAPTKQQLLDYSADALQPTHAFGQAECLIHDAYAVPMVVT
jgi:hypothetical protein